MVEEEGEEEHHPIEQQQQQQQQQAMDDPELAKPQPTTTTTTTTVAPGAVAVNGPDAQVSLGVLQQGEPPHVDQQQQQQPTSRQDNVETPRGPLLVQAHRVIVHDAIVQEVILDEHDDDDSHVENGGRDDHDDTNNNPQEQEVVEVNRPKRSWSLVSVIALTACVVVAIMVVIVIPFSADLYGRNEKREQGDDSLTASPTTVAATASPAPTPSPRQWATLGDTLGGQAVFL